MIYEIVNYMICVNTVNFELLNETMIHGKLSKSLKFGQTDKRDIHKP